MLKIIRLAIAGLFLTGAAYAGTTAYMSSAEPVMSTQAAAMGGMGAWLIPVLALALIALAMSNNGGTD